MPTVSLTLALGRDRTGLLYTLSFLNELNGWMSGAVLIVAFRKLKWQFMIAIS